MRGDGKHIRCVCTVDGAWGGAGWGKQARQQRSKTQQEVAPTIPPMISHPSSLTHKTPTILAMFFP